MVTGTAPAASTFLHLSIIMTTLPRCLNPKSTTYKEGSFFNFTSLEYCSKWVEETVQESTVTKLGDKASRKNVIKSMKLLRSFVDHDL